ncbi:hypothetical protein KPH14_008599 [Odynerus spinipes]|uniref:Apolipophorins n=1 Tax=Odynerus spinipes TaxID=1348599 RepID=A0AAD9RSE8_9HYME|nr:hypothetical protein KPH14_008599 [Odynerus spinipes]
MGHPPRLARAALILGLVLLSVISASASAKKCHVGCHGGHYAKAYQEGRTYVYRLEGTSVTSVTDAQGDATLKLKANVELTAKPDCTQQLRVKDVQVNDAPVALPNLDKYALQFNYHHGHIDSDVCAEPDDSQASLNIKRAVASLFQSAILQESGSTVHHETDVFGSCPTDFTFRKEGDSLVVQKYKDLSQCSYRENIKQGLVTSVFDTSSGIKSTPLLGSQQKIEQRFRQGVLNKATSTETYKFKPFSNGEAGAKTVIELTLTLKGEKGDSPTAPVTVPKSLIFEVPHPLVKSSVETLSNALKAASKEDVNVVRAHAAEKFAELVKVLRVSNKKDILSVYHKVSAGAGFDKVSDKKILLDALFRAGSGEVAEVAVELVKNRELTEMQRYLFYASLSLIRHVNLPAVTAVTSLLNQPDLPRIGYLGIGQVIGKYCQEHSCDNVAEVKDAIHKIREKVGNGKTKTRAQENVVVSALKALGNTRYMDDVTLQRLANIASDKQVRNRVRVGAIEALPAICSMKWKHPLLNVFADRDEDSEIRIKIYLSLVSCACPHVAEKLQEVLDKETVNQVGSFITSHLRNLRASTDPNKEAAKKFLGAIKPNKKFPEDFRKFSFNNELSYNLDAFGIGSSAESNVIYSQNSFIPRSASLNLTTEVFGQSFNFLELDTRVENLDRVIEHYFGPKGEFSKYSFDEESANKAIKTATEIAKYIRERFEQVARNKREVKQGELDRFAKNVRLRNTEVDQDLNVDLSLKLFGVELAYLSYQDDPHKFTPKNLIQKIFESLNKGFDLVKDFDYSFENHLHFLDAELVYPTGFGVPLSLGVTGTSVVHIKAKGKLDIPSILKNPDNAVVRIALEPSASIRVAGNMMLEAFGTNSGMAVVTTLHTATSSDVYLKLLDGTGFDVTFGMPTKGKTQEIITVHSDVLFTSGAKGEKLVAPKFSKGKEYSDCFDQLAGLLGLAVCGHVQLPYYGLETVQNKPFYPLSGPAKFSLSVEHQDVSSYYLKVYYNKKVPNARSLEVLLDTPNSRTNRRISLLLEGGLEPEKYLKVAFDSPIKKASALAVLKNKPEERTFSITVHNDPVEYYLRFGIIASGNKYKPVLEYKVPEHIEKLSGVKNGVKGGHGGQLYRVDGTIGVNDYEDGKKYTFENVVVTGAGRKIVGLDGSAVSTSNKALVDLKLSYNEESLAFKLDGKRLGEQHYEVAVSAVPSRDPNIGFNAKWEYNRQPNELHHKFVFVHGADPNSETNCFILDQHAVYKMDPKDLTLAGTSKITYPALNALLKLEGKLTRKSIEADLAVTYEKFKVGSELSAKIDMAKPGDYELELEVELLQNSIELKSKRTVIEVNKKSKFKNSLELSPGGKYEVSGVVTHDVNKNHINVQVDGDVNLNGKVIKVDVGLEAYPTNVNSRAIIVVSGTKYVDFILKGRGGPNPNGNLNLNLKNYLNAVGQFNYQNGKGNGRIAIDIPKYHRKIKGHGDLTIAGSRHAANVELLYDADKDPSKRIKLSTVSDITKTSIDTKNIIEVLSYKMEINGKGELKGQLLDGELKIDADATLPNGRYIVVSADRVSVKKGDSYDIRVQSKIVDHVKKGGESQQLIYNVVANNVNPKTITFQSKTLLKYVHFNGRDFVIDLGLKNLPKEGTDKKSGEIDLKLHGSTLPAPLVFGISGDYNDKEGAYVIKSSLENSYSFTAGGNVARSEPYKFDGTFSGETKLPFEKLQNLKVQSSLEYVVEPSKNFGRGKYSSDITYNNDKNIKLELDGRHTGDRDNFEGAGKISLTVLQFPTLSIEDTYKYTTSANIRKTENALKLNYGDKGGTLSLDVAYAPDLSTVQMNAKATTTMEKLRNIDLHLHHKRQQDKNHRQTDISLNLDSAKYILNTEIQEDRTAPMIHVTLTCPSGVTELLSKFQKLGENDYTGEWKIETPVGFVTADARVNLESIDNFLINLNFDSDKLKQRKIHAEITNKPTAKAGKRIIITVTTDGKNLVTGSTNYKKREEEGKIIVEGNGSLKIGENTRSSSFKYTRQQLTHETDGEVGVAMVLNANFGPSAIVGEVKLTNKEVHVFNSYCEQSKDCAHFKLQATLDTDKQTYLKQRQTVEVDLRKFNVPVEFGLQISTRLTEDIFDHTASLYMHSTKDKSQYTYQVYAHPKEAAAILTLPSREVALIVTLDVPKTKQIGSYKLTISSFLDRKNKPTEKTSLNINSDVTFDKASFSVSGDAKLIYPSQTKDMIVKGRVHCGGPRILDANLDIDVFSKKSQKITVLAKMERLLIPSGFNLTGSVEVLSRGQQLKVEQKVHLAVSSHHFGAGSIFSYTDENQKPKSVIELFSINDNEAHLLITSPNQELIRSDAKMEFSKNLQKLEVVTNILDRKPIGIKFEAHNLNTFTFLRYDKNKPNEKLTANGRIVLGQLAEVHADLQKNGDKKNLFHILVHLDENKFLKPDFGYNKETVESVMDYNRKQILEIANQLKEVTSDVIKETVTELKDLLEHLKKAQPNMKPLLDYYSAELTKFKNELNADQTVQEIQANLNKRFGPFFKAVGDISKQVIEQLNELFKQYNVIVSKAKEAIEATYPQLQESYNKIFRACMNIIDAAANLGTTYLKAILNIINEHQKEIKELAVIAADLAQDIAKIIFRASDQIKKDATEFVTLLINQVKALPVYEITKEKYNQIINFEVPEAITSPLEELCKTVRAMLPTEELRQFFGTTCDYILKLIKKEKPDNVSELNAIYTQGIAALKSLLGLIDLRLVVDNLNNFLETRVPIDLAFLSKLPGISTLKVSILNLVRNAELPSPLDVYYTYRPSLYLNDIVPPFSKTGVVADGGHIFTFDRNHLTFPGSCNYILAQDMLDGNFSVIANFHGGNLVSVTVTEPKESITLKSNGNILVNNKPAEYPVSTKNLHAFLTKPAINVKSDYGVHVMCTDRTPMVCAVRVSGFYLGKLRGLFGDANNEPYDDFTLPNGKITEDKSEFGNAYKLKQDCPAATATKPAPSNPTCTKFFSSSSSPLSSCFKYVDPTHYEEACNQAAQTNENQGSCLIATVYYGTCFGRGVIGVNIPASCASCKVGANTVAIGDSFSVKVPQKEADIIFVVEQEQKNEKVFKDMILPMMAELREELKQYGITDVHVGLIGFGEHMSWPQHYTTGGSTNIEGDVKNIKFEGKNPITTLQEAKEGNIEKKFEYLGQRLDVEFGTFKLTDAYEEAIRYPFRAGAAKAVIGVVASPCEKSPLPVSLQQLRLLLGQKMYRDLGLTYYHVSFPNDILVSGKPQKNVVGYDYDSVYTFADSKKRPLDGSNELRNTMVPSTNDVCADFAISSGGAAFSSNNFLEAKPNQRKQFVQVAVRRIISGLVDTEIEEDCVCEQNFGLIGRPRCKVVGRKEKEPLTRHTKGGVKG